MMRVTVTLEPEEKAALLRLAQIERRDPRRQAALILRQELERRGLLEPPGDGVEQARRAWQG
jgi:hypothetical protein